MMVVTDSRLAAVRYFHEIKRYIQERHYADMDILAAFNFGAVIAMNIEAFGVKNRKGVAKETILARNRGIIASFSRALSEGLSAQQSDADFNATLEQAIESIYQASIA